MSERTTIGGTVYEAIGSSSSNLLLRCNGTARIQWGGKLIDLIKNGKIASEDSLGLIYVVSNESEIKSDGIYILTTDESFQIIVNKDGNLYNLSGTDLYISASKALDLTADLKKQALDNIGIYFNTLQELQSSGIQSGLAYVIETKTLYTILNGAIEEFEAKLKTVTVEQTNTNGEVINSDVQIVLSVNGLDYLILSDQRINVNLSIYVKNSAQIGSESADKTNGYRLYIDGDTSYLDVDVINVRHGLKFEWYKEITFDQLKLALSEGTLEPHKWYVLTDYQNHWKLAKASTDFNRPLVIRALTNSSLYKEGYLFKDHTVKIHYDPTYQELITLEQSTGEYQDVTTKGRITWMKDSFNNEANFDFLDYTSASKVELSTLHTPKENFDKSIFPKNSYNNKLTVYDLKGTVLKDKVLDDSNTTIVDFQFDDSGTNTMSMYNNIIECRGLVLTPNCKEFYNNVLNKTINILIDNYFCNNVFSSIYNNINEEILDFSANLFSEIGDNNIFNTLQFNYKLLNVQCLEFTNSTVKSELIDIIFRNVNKCTFNEGIIQNVQYFCDLNNISIDSTLYAALYDNSKHKEVYLLNNTISIVCIPEAIFYRGMIIMHSGIEPIPTGWAICDGNTYVFNGVSTTTPNLIGKFIKADSNAGTTGGSNLLTLSINNLPEHTHTLDSVQTSENGANTHEHSISEQTTSTLAVSITDTYFTWNTVPNADTLKDMSDIITVKGTNLKSLSEGDSYLDYTSSSSEHTHSVPIPGISTQSYSEENHTHSLNNLSTSSTSGATNTPIDLLPEYYSLIFIMKL